MASRPEPWLARSEEYTNQIVQAVDREDGLVDNLLTLSHREPESLPAVSLPAFIGDVLVVLPAAPLIRVNGEAALAPAQGDADRLTETFMNRIENALEARPSRMELGDSGWVRLSVRSTGKAHRERVSVESNGVSEATFVVDLPAAPVVTAPLREETVRGQHG